MGGGIESRSRAESVILVDTHVLLWMSWGDRRLGAHARRRLEQARTAEDAAVSAVSFWEIATLVRRRRLTLPADPASWRRRQLADGLVEIPVDGEVATRAGLLADLHGDPADRLIVATALEGHTLLTADQRILDWPGALVRIDARS